MALIRIDEQEIQVKDGTTILQTAISAGIEIPHYCYHPALSIAGSCRLCVVEIKGNPRLQTSCSTRVYTVPEDRKTDGKYDMVVLTDSEMVRKGRKSILEFLLINHPLDCPVCDKAGECFLQDYTFKYGSAHSRFIEEKRVRPPKDLGPNIMINLNRCIMCTRCVRFTREISGTSELKIKKRGYYSEISVEEYQPLDNKLAGNVTDICPVGALLDKNYIHRNRIWNLQHSHTVCSGCSMGCNITIDHQKNTIFRIKPRYNTNTNGYWICDDGRYSYKQFEELKYISQPMVKDGQQLKPISWAGAKKVIVENLAQMKIKAGREAIGGVLSCHATNEENYLLYKLIGDVIGIPENIALFPDEITGEDETFPGGFVISSDKTPNRTGALDMAHGKIHSLYDLLKRKKIKGLIFINNGINSAISKEVKHLFKSLDFFLVIDAWESPVAMEANLVLPGNFLYAKNGSVTNRDGYIQRLNRSVNYTNFDLEGWEILKEIAIMMGGKGFDYTSVSEITSEIGKTFPEYSGISLFKLGNTGMKRMQK